MFNSIKQPRLFHSSLANPSIAIRPHTTNRYLARLFLTAICIPHCMTAVQLNLLYPLSPIILVSFNAVERSNHCNRFWALCCSPLSHTGVSRVLDSQASPGSVLGSPRQQEFACSSSIVFTRVLGHVPRTRARVVSDDVEDRFLVLLVVQQRSLRAGPFWDPQGAAPVQRAPPHPLRRLQ